MWQSTALKDLFYRKTRRWPLPLEHLLPAGDQLDVTGGLRGMIRARDLLQAWRDIGPQPGIVAKFLRRQDMPHASVIARLGQPMSFHQAAIGVPDLTQLHHIIGSGIDCVAGDMRRDAGPAQLATD